MKALLPKSLLLVISLLCFSFVSSTMAQNCNKPTSSQFKAVDIKTDHCYFECTINGSPRYDYQWRKKGTSNWSDLTATSDHRRKIEGLSDNTWYQYRCRYECDGDLTSWSDHKDIQNR